jgi:hypothetical protein
MNLPSDLETRVLEMQRCETDIKGMVSIIGLNIGWKKFAEKTIIITSEVIIIMYVQQHQFAF